MDEFELELKRGFLEEAKELITNTEQCFLSLERSSDDPKIIEQIFRLAHNLKGSASAVGFVKLKEFTHRFESLLLKVKNKEMQITPPLVNLLLRCNDYLSETVDALRADVTAENENLELIAQIEEYINGGAPHDAVPSNAAFDEPLTANDIPAIGYDAQGFAEETFEAPSESQNHEVFEVAQMPETPVFVPPPVIEAPKHEVPKTAEVKKAAAATDETIRVNLSKIDSLLNNVGELVILQTVLFQQKHNVHSDLVHKTIGQMSKIVKEIQETSMSLRMLPLKQTFQKMQRIVRDTSRELNKDVDLHLMGDETELDKTVIEQLGDPLVHLIRNAVDHGLESTEERIAAGKNEKGNVWLSAYHRGGQIIIEIKDDGKGLDPKKLIAKAVEKGIISASATLTDEQAYHLIFMPGFSTKTVVTDVSGRGVGMDVVKTNINQLQGDIELETELGKGTCFKIVLPLTLAIVDGLVVQLHEDRYVVPIAHVIESLQPAKEDVSYVNESSELLNLRGQVIPLYRLDNILSRSKKEKRAPWESISLVMKDNSGRTFGILVDEILCQQQVVIKQLGGEIQGMTGISGAAILGDGRTSLILDLFELTSWKLNLNNSQKNTRQKRSMEAA